VECLHCVLLDGQFIYANADQNVEVGVVAATRPVDAIMPPVVAALHSARDAPPDCVAVDPGHAFANASSFVALLGLMMAS